MCILSDHEIETLREQDALGIEPFVAKHVTPNGYDLTIGEVQVRGDGATARDGTVEVPSGRGFLVSTREYVRMPADVAGQLWIRSSYARRGVLASFGKVEAGFEGELTLAAFNASNQALEIPVGDRFAQLVFEKLHKPPAVAYEERSGNYQGQRGITHAKES